eukprot:3104070-Amphidinium_carterae.1
MELTVADYPQKRGHFLENPVRPIVVHLGSPTAHTAAETPIRRTRSTLEDFLSGLSAAISVLFARAASVVYHWTEINFQ